MVDKNVFDLFQKRPNFLMKKFGVKNVNFEFCKFEIVKCTANK